MDEILLVEARQLAIERHGLQMYGDKPYVVHLDAVVAVLRQAGRPLIELVAAYLHDVLEDTDTSEEELRQRFGEEVLALVIAVTGRGQNRKERKADTLAKLTVHKKAVNLKLGDRYCNMRQCYEDQNQALFCMYLKELPDYRHLFEQADETLWALMQELVQKAQSENFC